MAKLQQSNPGPEKPKGVQFAGRSVARQGGQPAQRQALGSWRKQIRKGIVWDQKSLIYLMVGVCLVLTLTAITVVSLAKSMRPKDQGPTAVADGYRVQKAGAAPNMGPSLEEFREDKLYQDLDRWAEVADTSEDPVEVARAWMNMGALHETRTQDWERALESYRKVIDDFSDTPSFMTAVGSSVTCALRLEDDALVRSIYSDALRKIGPNTTGASAICQQAIEKCGENSSVGKTAQSVMARIEASESEGETLPPDGGGKGP